MLILTLIVITISALGSYVEHKAGHEMLFFGSSTISLLVIFVGILIKNIISEHSEQHLAIQSVRPAIRRSYKKKKKKV